MLVTFWLSVGLLVFTYIGYPLSLWVVATLRPRPVQAGEDLPALSVIIAAYNEEKSIVAKLCNTLELDYPAEKLEVLVVSDHSSDKTDQFVQQCGDVRVKLVRCPERKGKTGAQNLAVTEARGEVLVFSDATTIYEKDALKKIVRSFSDPSVGGVEGRLIYCASGNGFLGNKDLLKSYEAIIKTWESQISTGVGDNGAFYAIRASLYRSLSEDLTSDFGAPLDVVRQQYRFVFDPEAICYEAVSANSWEEFRRKIRTVRAGLKVFWNSFDLLNPLVYPFPAYVLTWRKAARWGGGVFLIGMFVSNVFLAQDTFYGGTLVLQAVLWGATLVGVAAGDALDGFRPISIPKSFMLVNLAAVWAMVSCAVSGSREVWTPQR